MFLRKNQFSALFLPLLLSGLLQGCGASDDHDDITVDLGIPVRKDAMASIMPRIMSALSLNIGSECYQDQIYLGMRDTTTKEVLLMKKVPLRSKIINNVGITYAATSNDIEQVISYLKYNTELDEVLTIPAPRNSQVEVGVFGQFFKPEDNNKDGICDQHSQDINQINNKWVTLEEMVQAPRYLHTSSVLPDGSIYVVGGKSSYGSTDSTLDQTLYRPGTGGAWQNKNPLNTKRFRHTMTLTRSGKLVVIGGILNWTTGNSPTEPILLSNGIEILDTKSANSSWETKVIPNDLGYFTYAPYLHTATLLPDDRILIIGGNDAISSKASVSIYDPEKNSWENADDLPFARQHHTTVVVGNQVMVVGGESSLNPTGDNSNVFITRIGEWNWSSYSSQQLGAKRVSFTANAFKNDSVVVIGGTSTGTSTALNVRIKTDGSSETFPLLTPTLSNHNTHVLSDDRIVVFGGIFTASNAPNYNTYALDLNSSSPIWQTKGSMQVGRSGMTSHVIQNDRIIAIGGYTGSSPSTSKTVEAFIPYSPAIRSTALMGSGMIDNNAIFNREVRININLLHSTPTLNYDGSAGTISISNSPSKNKWIEIKPYLDGSYSYTSYLSSINYFKMGGEYLVKVPTRIDYSNSGNSQKNVYIPSMDDMELVFDIQSSGCNGFCAKYSVTVQENSLNASSGSWGSIAINPKLIDSPANPSGSSTDISGNLNFKRP